MSQSNRRTSGGNVATHFRIARYDEACLLIGGGPVAADPVARDNVTYFSLPGDGTSLDLGYGSGTSNAIVQDNVAVGGDTSFRLDGPGASVDGNIFVGPTQGADGQTFPGNEFHDTAPGGVIARVFPNEYEPGRGHVAIVNFDLQDEIEIDPAGVLEVGDVYEVRDAQNYFGDPVATGTYQGAPIVVPMTSTEVAPVIGEPATAFVHTSAELGAFVLMKTGEDPGGSDTGDGTSGADSTGAGDGADSAGGTAGASAGEGDDGDGAAGSSGPTRDTDAAGSQDGSGDGCSCRAMPPARGILPLLLALPILLRRRNG